MIHRKLSSSANKGDLYETEVLDQFEDTDSAGDFFTRLYLQLNKVNELYKGKEEFVDRADSLRKQMDILVEHKIAMKEERESKDDLFISSISFDDESFYSPTELEQDQSFEKMSSDCENNEIKLCDYPQTQQDDSENPAKNRIIETSKLLTLSSRVFNYQGKNLKFNIPLSTPSRIFSALSYMVWEDFINQSKKYGAENSKLHINKTELRHAKNMIRGAYIELFTGLSYLRTYRNMNMLAFVKILNKFDKLMGKQILPTYSMVVESSYFNSSDMAIKLMDKVEDLFTKNFADDDKRKALKYLKPNVQKESHVVTFFVGLFTGFFISLFIGYCIMAHNTGMYDGKSNTIYMKTVYPVLSMFSLLFLHLFLYGCNIFMWRKTRINYRFIFDFSPTNELKYRDIFLICSTSMTIVVGVMFVHISLTLKGYTSIQIQAIPGILLLMFVMVLVCPFNILYQTSRYKFLRILRNIIMSPFYKVVMVDFFMADQLCSQCARRWFDEEEGSHLLNLGKYVSAIIAAGTRVAYEKKTFGSFSLVVVMSSTTTMYQLYWDFVMDWGLLQLNLKNPWLRNELIFQCKIIYFLSIGVNFVLRLAWLQTVLHSTIGNLDYGVISFLLAALEVIRRGLWNFYRLENEHLKNAKKFRAVKNVPLPFHKVDLD